MAIDDRSRTSLPAITRFLGYDPFPVAATVPERLVAKRRELGWSRKRAAKAWGIRKAVDNAEARTLAEMRNALEKQTGFKIDNSEVVSRAVDELQINNADIVVIKF